jgi:vancomycin resistance protein YoaR
MKRRRKRRRKKRLRLIFAILSFLTLTSLPVIHVYATESKYRHIIYPGVYIEGLDVSGKTLEEAKRLIEENYEKVVIEKEIKIIAGDKSYSLSYSQLKPEYNIEETIKEAFNYGKDEDLLSKYSLIKKTRKKEYKLAFKYDTAAVKELLDKIDKEVESEAVDATITIEAGNVKITEASHGRKLKREELEESILNSINNQLSEELVEIKAPLQVTKPAVTKAELEKMNQKISGFSTKFTSSSANRINNIELATRAINGTTLMPGDTFSFNEIVGQRTRERGYKDAGVIIGDSIQSGLGGGICQVSSTLYNAVLNAGLKFTERRNHTLTLTYIPMGLDATIDWGNIDYKFTNTLDYPIYIEGYTKDKTLYFNIYSNDELSKYTYEMETEVYEVIQPKMKYINSNDLLEGETKVLKWGSKGYKVKVYRKTYENGKLINTEFISNDYYHAVDGQALRGTKKAPILAEEKKESVEEPDNSKAVEEEQANDL